MKLPATECYGVQLKIWPKEGQHILANFDQDTIILYQAYGHRIADYAVEHQRFGGDFRYSRMSWVKPNFLWVMYRCGWAQKPDQERVLAVRVRRSFFDGLLKAAVPSSFEASVGYPDRQRYKAALAASQVRLQWDPDHDPLGNKQARRAIQLGLRGDALEEYGRGGAICEIMDMTPLVIKERKKLSAGSLAELRLPRERVYAAS